METCSGSLRSEDQDPTCLCPHLAVHLSPPLLLELHCSWVGWVGLLLSLTGPFGAGGFLSLSFSLRLWRMELIGTSQGPE